jgi:hypothetical protein
MERKGSRGTVEVTTEEVRAKLARAKTLTSEEDKALRMRHGAGAPDLRAPLPQAAGGNAELQDELLLVEMQLLRAFRARGAPLRSRENHIATPMRASAEPTSSRAKEKIIRALRKKK